MLWFKKITPKKEQEKAMRPKVLALHAQIIDRVLTITAESHWNMDDNFDFRFDVTVFLISDLLHLLHLAEQKQPDRTISLFSQMLLDVMFEGFEESLRDRGVTDIRIASRMRKLLQSAMGRRNAYLEAWQHKESHEAIRPVIARNIFNLAKPDDPRIELFLTNQQGFAQSLLRANAALFNGDKSNNHDTNIR